MKSGSNDRMLKKLFLFNTFQKFEKKLYSVQRSFTESKRINTMNSSIDSEKFSFKKEETEDKKKRSMPIILRKRKKNILNRKNSLQIDAKNNKDCSVGILTSELKTRQEFVKKLLDSEQSQLFKKIKQSRDISFLKQKNKLLEFGSNFDQKHTKDLISISNLEEIKKALEISKFPTLCDQKLVEFSIFNNITKDELLRIENYSNKILSNKITQTTEKAGLNLSNLTAYVRNNRKITMGRQKLQEMLTFLEKSLNYLSKGNFISFAQRFESLGIVLSFYFKELITHFSTKFKEEGQLISTAYLLISAMFEQQSEYFGLVFDRISLDCRKEKAQTKNSIKDEINQLKKIIEEKNLEIVELQDKNSEFTRKFHSLYLELIKSNKINEIYQNQEISNKALLQCYSLEKASCESIIFKMENAERKKKTPQKLTSLRSELFEELKIQFRYYRKLEKIAKRQREEKWVRSTSSSNLEAKIFEQNFLDKYKLKKIITKEKGTKTEPGDIKEFKENDRCIEVSEIVQKKHKNKSKVEGIFNEVRGKQQGRKNLVI